MDHKQEEAEVEKEAAAVGGWGEVEDAMRHAIVPFDKAEPLEVRQT
jgi:hypothetical protein